MNLLKKTFCAVLMVLMAQACAQAADVKQGHDLFMKRGCYQCHGTVGQGGNAGPSLSPNTMPYESFRAIVRSPPNEMPPFSEKILSNAELQDIHVYLTSLPKPQAANSIKLLPKPGP